MDTEPATRVAAIAESMTERQREVYRFIVNHFLHSGCSPTVREIMQHFDWTGPNAVACHIKALEKKGLIRRRKFESRGIELLAVRRCESCGGIVGAI